MLKLIFIGVATVSLLLIARFCRAESGKKDGYATRSIDGGTKIKLVIGTTAISGVLNGTKSAKDLIAKLPYTVRMQRYEHDYCGVMKDTLAYDKEDLRSGWKNGDISFAVDGNYFTVLFKDEEISQQFDGIVNMGVISEPLAVMDSLERSISVRIELE